MRIIAGEFRSRQLLTPRDAETVRPIPDRVKESLFSLLRGHCEGAGVFDLFAGTGAIGLEAVSRGAAHCVMVEKDRDVADLLRKNIAALGVQARAEVIVADALGPSIPARCPDPVNLIFLDPPYPVIRDELGYRRVIAQAASLLARLAPGGFLILRTPWPLLVEPPEEKDTRSARRTSKPPGTKRRKDDFDPSEWLGRSSNNASAGKPPTGRGRAPTDDADDESELDDHTDGLDDPSGDPSTGADAKPKGVKADVKIPGAVGPETHVYHQMAVHLYMRAPETSAVPRE